MPYRRNPLTGQDDYFEPASGGGGNADTLDGLDSTAFALAGHTHAHSALTGVSADQHHAQVHALVGADHVASGLTPGHVLQATGATTFAFAALANVDATTLDGIDSTGFALAGHTHAHGNLTGIGPNDHHAQVHVLATTAGLGADHTVSGLTAGQVLRATGPTTAVFGAIQAGDLPDLSGVYQPLDADLTALAALAGTGLLARTGAGTAATRAITGSASINVANGDGVAGNPTLSVLAAGVDHNALANLAAGDVHTQYIRALGRAGGQTWIGGTGSGERAVVQSTSHATKGTVDLDDAVRLWPSFPEPGTGATARLVDFDPTLTAFNNSAVAFYGVSIRPNYAYSGPLNMSQSIFHFGGVQEDDAGAGSNAGVIRVVDVDATFRSESESQIPPGAARLFDDRTTTEASADTANVSGNVATHYGLHVVPTFRTFGALAAASLGVNNTAAVRFAPVLSTAAGGQVVDLTTVRGLWCVAASASGAGTEQIGTYVGVDVENQALASTFIAYRSQGSGGQGRHAGSFAFGVNGAPSATVDISGDLATRRQDIAIVNGANNDVPRSGRTFLRLTGGGAAPPTLSGFTGGVDGLVIAVFNDTGNPVTMVHNATSTAANQLLLSSGANTTLPNQRAMFFFYDTNASRWQEMQPV